MAHAPAAAPPLRIDLMAPPYSGHLHPILAMARTLAAHHEVRVFSTPAAQASIAACGLRGVAVLTPADDALLSAIANPGHAVRSNPWRMHQQLRAALALFARLHTELCQRYAQPEERPGLIISDFTLASAGLAAQACGIPWWTSLPSPCVLETPDGPPGYFGGLRPARTPRQALWHASGRQLTRLFKRLVFALHRRQIGALGLAGPYRADGSEAVYSPDCILALGVPELEFPRSWPAPLHFIGPQLLTPPTPVADPPFIAGRQHVLVTAGTHLDWSKAAMAQAVQAAARALPDVEFHLTLGHAQHQAQASRIGNFTQLAYVDYARHLPHYDLVVHHGGAGILYACLATGRRALVHPVDYDQFDHAARLEAAQAAPWLRRWHDLPQAVAQALAPDAPGFAGLPALQAAVQQAQASVPLLALVAAQAQRTGTTTGATAGTIAGA